MKLGQKLKDMVSYHFIQTFVPGNFVLGNPLIFKTIDNNRISKKIFVLFDVYCLKNN